MLHAENKSATAAIRVKRDIRLSINMETPPDEKTLKGLLKKLGISARYLLRKGEDEYKALKLDIPALKDDALIAAMCKHPKLIERPIVVHGKQAAIGRPPEKVLEIL